MPNIFQARIMRGKLSIAEYEYTGKKLYDGFMVQRVAGCRLYTVPGLDASGITSPGWGNTPDEAAISLYVGKKKAVNSAIKTSEKAIKEMNIIDEWRKYA